jgi:HSP20 family molecular chaperone IbpA
MFGRDTERMMQMWADLLNEIEGSPLRNPMWERVPDRIKRQQVGSVEDRDTEIVLSADLPGIEKKDIELKVDTHSIAFSAKTEERKYDFAQSFDFDLKPSGVNATFVNGVLDVVVQKSVGTQGKTIKIK